MTSLIEVSFCNLRPKKTYLPVSDWCLLPRGHDESEFQYHHTSDSPFSEKREKLSNGKNPRQIVGYNKGRVTSGICRPKVKVDVFMHP